MPPQPQPPGPGQYNLVDYKGPEKEYISSSVFKSTTNRWNNRKTMHGPGPGNLIIISYNYIFHTTENLFLSNECLK